MVQFLFFNFFQRNTGKGTKIMSKNLANTLTSLGMTLVLTLTPTGMASTASEIQTIGGTLLKETIHELPTPAVALASDGRALVVWQDSTAETSGDCTDNGGACSIVGAIVEADGVSVGAPFVLSGAGAGRLEVSFYAQAPSVVWNEDRKEWLVLMTSGEGGFYGVYAQRVSADGTLAGTLVTLPTFRATPFGDRDTIVDLTEDEPRVQASATWSSVHAVYLVTWHARGDFTSLGLDGNPSTFGFFMTGELASADGVDAAFVMQDKPLNSNAGLVKQNYSPELDQWAFIWAAQSGPAGRKVQLTTLEFEDGAFNVGASREVVDTTDYSRARLLGDIVWVDSLNAWILTWSGEPTSGDGMSAYARTIAADGSLGAPAKVSDFGITRYGTEVGQMYSHNLEFDSVNKVVYASGHIESQTGELVAALWSFDPATMTPIDWVEYIAPRNDGETSADFPSPGVSQSSRPIISGFNGGIAVVYQNWKWGWISGPQEVRFHLVSEVTEQEQPEQEQPEQEQRERIGGGSVAPVAEVKDTKTVVQRIIRGFSADSSKLSKQQRQLIRKVVNSHNDSQKLVCVGSTSGQTADSFNKRLATNRAQEVCKFAKRVNPELETGIRIRPSVGLSERNRKVVMRFHK
jgi:hypothetical protein